MLRAFSQSLSYSQQCISYGYENRVIERAMDVSLGLFHEGLHSLVVALLAHGLCSISFCINAP